MKSRRRQNATPRGVSHVVHRIRCESAHRDDERVVQLRTRNVDDDVGISGGGAKEASNTLLAQLSNECESV